MRYINCLNNISAKGTDLLGSDYQLTDDIAQASGVLVAAYMRHGPFPAACWPSPAPARV